MRNFGSVIYSAFSSQPIAFTLRSRFSSKLSAIKEGMVARDLLIYREIQLLAQMFNKTHRKVLSVSIIYWLTIFCLNGFLSKMGSIDGSSGNRKLLKQYVRSFPVQKNFIFENSFFEDSNLVFLDFCVNNMVILMLLKGSWRLIYSFFLNGLKSQTQNR